MPKKLRICVARDAKQDIASAALGPNDYSSRMHAETSLIKAAGSLTHLFWVEVELPDTPTLVGKVVEE